MSQEILDPITLEPMKFPFCASDGHTYDIESLVQWIESSPMRSSPMTRETLRPLAFWHEQLATKYGLVEPKQRVAVLYRGDVIDKDRCESRLVEWTVTVNKRGWMHSQWITLVMQAKDMTNVTVMIDLCAERQEDDSLVLLGYPCAENVKDIVIALAKDLGIANMAL